MMKLFSAIFCLFFVTIQLKLVASLNENEEKSFYDGFKVFELTPKSDEALRQLKQLFPSKHSKDDEFAYKYWREPTQPGKPCHILVSPDEAADFEAKLVDHQDYGIDSRLLVDDVRDLIEETNNNPTGRSGDFGDIVGTRFARLNEIYQWIDNQCQTYPKLTTCGQLDGLSYENRTIKFIKIGKPSSGDKKVIFLESGMHSREWLAPASMIYIIDKLLINANKDATIKKLLTKYDWFIVPIANPDGYEYSHTTDRMWRKNRRPPPDDNNNPACYGIDLNRNFDFLWNSIGASSDPCDETYAGTEAFSEPETLALSKFVTELHPQLLAYFSIHSYGRFWLVPYGAGSSKPDDFEEMLRVAKIGGRELMKVDKKIDGEATKWTIDNTEDALYPAAGGVEDWVKQQLAPKYAYCLELRPGSSAKKRREETGFIARPEDIKPSGEEVWAGIAAAVRVMKANN